MTSRPPRWAWLFVPQLFVIVSASVLAANGRLPSVALDGGLDKVGHFALLGGLSFFAVALFGPIRWLRVVGVIAALSALEEASQAWFPARTVDVGDLAANLLGIAIGGWLAARLGRRQAGYADGRVAPAARDKSPPTPISPQDEQPDADQPDPDRLVAFRARL